MGIGEGGQVSAWVLRAGEGACGVGLGSRLKPSWMCGASSLQRPGQPQCLAHLAGSQHWEGFPVVQHLSPWGCRTVTTICGRNLEPGAFGDFPGPHGHNRTRTSWLELRRISHHQSFSLWPAVCVSTFHLSWSLEDHRTLHSRANHVAPFYAEKWQLPGCLVPRCDPCRVPGLDRGRGHSSRLPLRWPSLQACLAAPSRQPPTASPQPSAGWMHSPPTQTTRRVTP